MAMTNPLLSEKNTLNASAINPFDRSYNKYQHGFDTAVLALLSDVGNFTINIIQNALITDMASYEMNPNIWIMEQLINGSCDISSTTMILTPEMKYPTLYSFGIGTFRPQLFYKAKSVREEYNIYYIPFSSQVWISLFGLLLIITATLTFILSRETKLPHDTPYDIIAKIADEKHDNGTEWNKDGKLPAKESILQREKWDIGEILLTAVGVLCQQGSARDPSTSAARMLLLVMFVLAVVAYTAYSASVISFVSLLPTTEKELSTISNNLPKDRNIMVQDTNFFRHLFRTSRAQREQFPFQPCSAEINYVELQRGLGETIRGKVLFIGNQDSSLTHIHREGYSAEYRCSLARVFLGFEYQRVFAFRNDSRLREMMNSNIIRIQEFGFLSREKKKYFDVRHPCSFTERSSVSGFVSFNLEDIKPALYMLSYGLLASIFLLFLEFSVFTSSKMVRKMFTKRRNKNNEISYQSTLRSLQATELKIQTEK